MTLKLGYAAATAIFLVFFVVTLAAQIRARRYHPLTYWLVVEATTTVGTTTSDFIDRTLHLGYVLSSAMLLALVVLVLIAWRLPTGARTFDTGHPSLFLPVWMEKDFGKWSVFGGGGYDLNPGRGNKDFTLSGIALTRAFSKRLNLGVELYHQTPGAVGGPGVTNLGFGAIYQLTRHWALMASGGPALQSPARSGASAFYASLQFTD